MPYKVGERIQVPEGTELRPGPGSDGDFFITKEMINLLVAGEPIDGSQAVILREGNKEHTFYLPLPVSET